MGMVAVPPWARAILPVRLHAMKLVALLFAAAVAQAAAQGYPNRPVKLIVPAPAGGPDHGPGRPLAPRLAGPRRPPLLLAHKGGAACPTAPAPVAAHRPATSHT